MAELRDVLQTLTPATKRLLARNGQLGEANTKAALIDPMLQALGWDTHDLDQVQQEFRLRSRDNPVDYALFISGRPRLFVEAKNLGGDLGQHKWKRQAVNYANTAGVEWCALTDGNRWQLYKSNAPVDLEHGEAPAPVPGADRLQGMLRRKDNWNDGGSSLRLRCLH